VGNPLSRAAGVNDPTRRARRKKPTARRYNSPNAQGSERLNYERSTPMIRKLKSGGYRLYSRKIDPKTGRRRNLGTFKTRAAAEKHERAVQFFKRH
jgi:hypothetical protein